MGRFYGFTMFFFFYFFFSFSFSFSPTRSALGITQTGAVHFCLQRFLSGLAGLVYFHLAFLYAQHMSALCHREPYGHIYFLSMLHLIEWKVFAGLIYIILLPNMKANYFHASQVQQITTIQLAWNNECALSPDPFNDFLLRIHQWI